jgi:hypothetical protein
VTVGAVVTLGTVERRLEAGELASGTALDGIALDDGIAL